MAGEVTYAQLMQSETIMGVIAHIKAPGTFFQRFFNCLPGQPGVKRMPGNQMGWDVFNPTRTRAQGRAPITGPGTVSRKPIGHVSAQAYRSHEKTKILDGEVYRGRPMGGAFGTVDVRGQSYVAAQIKFLKQRFTNAREFMLSRLFRGGFGVVVDGEAFKLVELGAGTFDVNFQHPAANRDYLAIGPGGANLVTESWENPNADIFGFFLELQKAMTRLTGYSIKHAVINSSTLAMLFNNVGLAGIGGSAYRIFDSWTKKELDSPSGSRESGYDVVFRAIPHIIFHVYDEVDVPGDTDPTTMTTALTSLYVPDGKVILLPDPDTEWIGWMEGSEIVRENIADTGREIFGFHSWTTPIIDPPGQELKMLDIGLPGLFVPGAFLYATISGF